MNAKVLARLQLGNVSKECRPSGEISGTSQPDPDPLSLFRFSVEQILSGIDLAWKRS